MKKLKNLLMMVVIAFIISLIADAIVLSSFWLSPNPQYAFSIQGATTADVFVFGKPDEPLVIVEIEGILYTGTSVEGTIEKCAADGGLPCDTIQAGMLFTQGLNTFTVLISSTIAADQTLKWTTVSSSAPGYLFVTLRYYPTG